VDAAAAAAKADPLNPMVYRSLAGSLVSANRQDEAAAQLMTGFMVTGNQELRQALADLYQQGLDTERCAVTRTGDRLVLNSSCAIVRRHLCAASLATSRVHKAAGHSDLEAQALASMRLYNCEGAAAPRN
jgi:hypothetical protein